MKKIALIGLFLLSIAVLFAFQKPNSTKEQEAFVVDMPTPLNETSIISKDQNNVMYFEDRAKY